MGDQYIVGIACQIGVTSEPIGPHEKLEAGQLYHQHEGLAISQSKTSPFVFLTEGDRTVRREGSGIAERDRPQRQAEEPILLAPPLRAAAENWRGRAVLDAGVSGAQWEVRERRSPAATIRSRVRFPATSRSFPVRH